MFAQVIPFRRLPSQFETLLYKVPKEMEEHIVIGQIVQIPFRKTNALGIVFSFSDAEETNIQNIRDIDGILSPSLLSSENLVWYRELAQLYHAPLNTILERALPPLQKRKLKKLESFSPSKAQGVQTKNTYFLYTNEEERKEFLKTLKTGKILILVPEKKYIESLFLFFQENNIPVYEWQSDLSPKSQFTNWFQILQMENGVVIGTRNACFLPLEIFSQVVVDFEHNGNHKHWDQSPRFHAKDILELFSKKYPLHITFMSFSPSLEAYKKIYENTLALEPQEKTPTSPQDMLFSPVNHNIEVIDMSDEKKGNNYSFLSYNTAEAIQDAPGDVFIYINRKGFATSLLCDSCGKAVLCDKCQLPMVYHERERKLKCHYCHIQKTSHILCESCGKGTLQNRGFGTEAVEKEMKKIQKDMDTLIIRIDSSIEEAKYPFDEPQKKIIIGTQMAFQFLNWEKISTIIFIDVDRELAQAEFSSTENVWHTIQETQYFRKQDSRFLIQTQNKEHLIFRSLTNPDRFYRTELNLRKSLGYPPYAFLTRFFIGQETKDRALSEAETTAKRLMDALTKTQKSVMIHPPFEMHPLYFRNKYWYCIIAKMKNDNSFEDTLFLNKLLSPQWKTDPNPLSLLSP
ncbi:MAG: primosomal protein N' [Candidatus Magasanikbacteria bacterium]